MVRPLALVPVLLAAALTAQVQSPKQFLGHDIGEDHYLCNYTDLMRYWRAIEAATPRVRLREIGTTSYGQKMHMAVITSPENHAKLEGFRDIARRLCLAKDVADEAAAKELARQGKAVVWIDSTLHSTEAVAGQNIIELVWRLASRDDDETTRILDQVIVLACPVNPDGLEMIANAYAATRSMTIPVLYQRYIGHDNNRDFYSCNQDEAQHINRVFYREWFPQIVYNHHQSAPQGTIIYVPPFRDPFNYNADPNVIRGIEVVSAHMNARFAREGKPGVINRSGAPYSGWWNGGLRTTNYFHNIIGILTESFGRPEPTRVTQTLSRRLPYGDYPDPVPTQMWHARQTIEYLQTANYAILDYASRYREELLFGIWRMGRNSIERGSRDHWTPTPRLLRLAEAREDDKDAVFTDPAHRDPRVYVLPADQRDFSAARRFVRSMQWNGIEVLRATAAFAVGDRQVPAGSFVIKTAQAFRPHVIDMFEPQWHPDDIRDGKPVPPYDSAGWTLAMQFDLEVLRLFDDLQGPFEPLRDVIAFGPEPLARGAGSWQLDPHDSHTVIAINELLNNGHRVEWSPRGFYSVPSDAGTEAVMARVAATFGVRAKAVDADTREARQRVNQVRVGLFDLFGGSMPVGWDQWLLQEFRFPVQQVFGARIAQGDLRRDFDVLVFHAGLPGGRDLAQAREGREGRESRDGRGARDPENLAKLAAALPPFEDWSNLTERAVRLSGENSLTALQDFVDQGGTLIALGGECEKVVRHFELPIRIGPTVTGDGGEPRRTRREEFYVPGSLLAIDVDQDHPLAIGTPAQIATMVDNSSAAFEVTGDGVEIVASYANDEPLRSGWAIGQQHIAGKPAVVQIRRGQGRIVLFGANVTYRAQPVASFKLLFQAILGARMGG